MPWLNHGGEKSPDVCCCAMVSNSMSLARQIYESSYVADDASWQNRRKEETLFLFQSWYVVENCTDTFLSAGARTRPGLCTKSFTWPRTGGGLRTHNFV